MQTRSHSYMGKFETSHLIDDDQKSANKSTKAMLDEGPATFNGGRDNSNVRLQASLVTPLYDQTKPVAEWRGKGGVGQNLVLSTSNMSLRSNFKSNVLYSKSEYQIIFQEKQGQEQSKKFAQAVTSRAATPELPRKKLVRAQTSLVDSLHASSKNHVLT